MNIHRGTLGNIIKRIITARYNSAFVKLIIVVWYAQTEDAEKDVLDDSFQKTVDKAPAHNILMGNLNSKLGNDNSGKEGKMGKHGLGMGNNTGEMLGTFSQENYLVVGGSIFMYLHKTTWNSLDVHTKNQIDNKRLRRSLMDAFAMHDADFLSEKTFNDRDAGASLLSSRNFQG